MPTKTFLRHNPDQSWLAGSYPALNAEINTRLPYVSIGDFYAQGDDAQLIIDEIHDFWLLHDCTTEDAVKVWINSYL